MAIDYARMQSVATRLLTENGKDFTLNRYDGGVTLPDGSDSRGTAQAYAVTGVTVPWSDSQLNSSTINASDIQLKIEAVNVEALPGGEILPSDKIIVDGVEHGIVINDIKKPADTPLAYFLQLRA